MSKPRGPIREIDGLRGIAILFVMLHHFWPQGGPLEAGHDLAHLGWIGVDLFYVVSGYLICGILLETKGEPTYYRNYLARRALRVFPLYYLFLIAAFIAIPALQGGPWSQSEFVQQSGSPAWYAFYLGNVREAIHGHEPAYVLAPLWSLSIEEQFYLTFPFLVAFTTRDTLRKVLTVLLFAAPVFRVVMLLAFPANERIQYLATPSRMDVLALGCLLAIRQHSNPLPMTDAGKKLLGTIALFAVACLGLAFTLGGLDRNFWFCRSIGYSMVGLTMVTILWWTLERVGTPATRFLRWKPLTLLGKICYGVYLLQRPTEVALVLTLDKLHVHPDPGAIWLMFAKLAAAIAVAAVSWRVFEKPVLRLKRLFRSERHPLGE